MSTRLYLPSSGTPPIASATKDSNWEDTSSTTTIVLPARTSRFNTAMATKSFFDASAADRDCLLIQYIWGPLSAQTIAALTAVTIVMRCKEQNLANNLFLAFSIRIFAPDGTTLRGTLIALNRDNTEMSNGLVSRIQAVLSSSVVVTSGDYMVIEIGAGGDPAAGNTHQFDLRVGDSAGSDLASADDESSDYNPYIDFSNTILEPGSTGQPTISRKKLMGIGRKGVVLF